MKYYNYFFSLVLGAALISCGGASQESSSTESSDAKSEPKEISAPETNVSDTVYIEIEGNDLMQYNLSELEVTEGQTIKLTLKHVGQMASMAMGHNWVLLKPGTDKSTFGAAAVTAKEFDYIPQDMIDQVIANTSIVGGGEETSVVFEAPTMGYYDYICTFPGHWGVMQGTLTVNPK